MQKDNIGQLFAILLIFFLLVLLAVSSKIATFLGSDIGVTFTTILFTLIVVVPLFYALKYYHIKANYFAAIIIVVLYRIWLDVIVNIAVKHSESTYWNNNWFKFVVGICLFIVVFWTFTDSDSEN